MELSTPTLPGYGIDETWQETDMRYWHLRCRCRDGLVLEDNWPDCVGIRGDSYFLRCPKCGKENLDPEDFATIGEYRGWVPKYPGREIRGYHSTQLLSKYIALKEIWRLWISGKDREEFYNSKLGLPYAGDRMPLTLPVLQACQIGEFALDMKRKGEKDRLFHRGRSGARPPRCRDARDEATATRGDRSVSGSLRRHQRPLRQPREPDTKAQAEVRCG
jgi:hypothetical protein